MKPDAHFVSLCAKHRFLPEVMIHGSSRFPTFEVSAVYEQTDRSLKAFSLLKIMRAYFDPRDFYFNMM